MYHLQFQLRTLVIRLEMKNWCLALLLMLFTLHLSCIVACLNWSIQHWEMNYHWWLRSEIAKMSDNGTGKKKDNVSPSFLSIEYTGFPRHQSPSRYPLISFFQLKILILKRTIEWTSIRPCFLGLCLAFWGLLSFFSAGLHLEITLYWPKEVTFVIRGRYFPSGPCTIPKVSQFHLWLSATANGVGAVPYPSLTPAIISS